MSVSTSRPYRTRAGFTITELAVVLAVIGILASFAIPATDRMTDNRRLHSSADVVSWAFSHARDEAVRSGNLHIVFIGVDAQGDALEDSPGHPVDILILDDGRPGSALQNCKIDGGEGIVGRRLEHSVSFGLSDATTKAANDIGAGDPATGSSFGDAGGGQAHWVLFRPEGMPLSFSADCSMGPIGAGGGGVYLTNGVRDAATVVAPLGSTRIHAFRPDTNGWSS